jgi:hypothetical protein
MVLTGLTAKSTYHFQVQSVDGQGNTATSSDQTFMTAYEGLVATRGLAPINLNTTNRQLMSRSPHYARDDITSLKVAIPNWRVRNASPFDEQGVGSTATVTASVEYPSGTFTRVLFGGVASGTIANGSTIFSDYTNVNIPNGSLFWIRIYYTSSTGVLSIPQDTSAIGSGLETGVSGISDKTMSGTVTSAGNTFPPIAIIGVTAKPSVIAIGDSKLLGANDLTGDSSGDFGDVDRSIGPSFAYSSSGQNGDAAFRYVSAHAQRNLLLPYASDLIVEYGSNDLSSNRSASTVLSDLETIWGYAQASGLKVYQVTITPRTTSTDSWATTANQMTWAQNSANNTLNDSIRALPSGLQGAFDLSDVISTSRGSGIWIANGTANYYTTDGIHESTNANLLIKSSSAIATTSITR